MNAAREFLSSGTGQLVLLGAMLLAGGAALRWHHRRAIPALPKAKLSAAAPMPRTFVRKVAPFPTLSELALAGTTGAVASKPSVAPERGALPLTLVAASETAMKPRAVSAPYGRLIPCETVVALESNRLDTPVIGLVTQDVWHEGKLVVPAGAEVHGRAALDRTRERLAVQGTWRIVWRTPGADNGTDLQVEGLALDRDYDDGVWGEHDGSAGLRGQIIRTQDDRELKLFVATFLATATSALQTTTSTIGALGEAALPVATARNATLAGSGAVLREYAQNIRDAIARDGFYLRVPAGKQFYLYVTQTLDRSQARRGASGAPPQP